MAGIREVLIITTPRRRATSSSGCSVTAPSWGIDLALRRAAPARRAWRRRSSSARTSSASEQVALVLGDNIFYGAGLGTALKANTEVDGGHVFAYHVSNPQRVRRRRVRRRRAAVVDRGEADRAAQQLRRARPVLLRQRRRRDRARDHAERARRARDHRRQRALPAPAARLRVDRARPRDGLARHRDVRLADGRRRVRAGGRAAPGPARSGASRRSPGARASSTPTQLAALAEPLRKSGYGDYLLDLLT